MNPSVQTKRSQTPFLAKTYEIRCTPDVKYGEGGIGFTTEGGSKRYRDLLLDVYEPIGDSGARPALIMAFGGAFHRGSKGAEVFEGENPSTAVAEYCREFARRGYVCFSIDYRLMQENPDPGVTPILMPGQPQNRDRIDFVRNLLGLPPSTPDMMANVIEAATDDMTKAVYFARSRSRFYNIDVDRMAVGGFSAGATIALNAAFAERVPVAAAVALSGRMGGASLANHVTGGFAEPALIVFHGQHDLPVILDGIDEMRTHLTSAGIKNQFACVPDANHFYLRTSPVLRPDGGKSDVEAMMAEFLYENLGLSKMSKARVA